MAKETYWLALGRHPHGGSYAQCATSDLWVLDDLMRGEMTVALVEIEVDLAKRSVSATLAKNTA